MADYYRKTVNKVVNDVKLKMQLGALTLKLNENNNKIDDLIGVDKNIKKDVSSNSGLISTNTLNISDNLEKINDIKSSLPTSEIFKKTYSIKNQSFRFTRNIVYFKLLEIEIENNFKIDGILEFDNYIYYKYDNLQRDHHRLQHEYRIFDDKNNLLYKKILNKTNTSDLDFDKNIMLVKDNFYVTFKNNYNKIKIILDLFRVYRHGTGNFNLELINESFVNITYLDKNDISLKIDTNTRDISSNLGKINTNTGNISTNLDQINTNTGNISTILIKTNSNEDNILSNSSELDYIKNNISKSYLKNLYNVLFYDDKTQINFKGIFYEKIFTVNAKQNDFIEINLKMLLEYENINEKIYVNTVYEILDENNNSLYISTINNNDYNYFSNKVSIKENIFYNFTKNVKNIKFRIKFVMTTARVIKIWYIKNDNYRFILKHYSS